MANKKITDLTAIASGLASGDLVPLVDVSDTTDAATGTTKKMAWLNYLKEIFGSKFAADAGANDTYVATLSPAPAAYVTGEHYRFKANSPNTAACTINFNGLGAKTIKKAAGGITSDLADNDIRAGQWVDLVYDGTNMQMQSLLGNAPSSGATTLDGLTDVVISSPSTDQVLKYNGSEWVNSAAPAGSATFADGGMERYRIVAGVTRINSSNVDSYGGAILTAFADGAASVDDADGPFRRYDTAATNTTTAGVSFNNAALTRTDWLPQISIKLKTHTSIAVCNIWAGLLSATPGADDPAQHGAAFRYSTAAGDTNWKAWSNDGSGGGTITDTGVAVATSTLYSFAIVVESTSSIKFYISTDNGVTYSLVATHTTNLPTSSQGMDCWLQMQTLENVAKSIKHSFTHIRMR